MKVAGIITEYNPFHLGHEYQIIKTRSTLSVDYIVVVMSGNFVQRGEPALLDKWERTKLALAGGADLVIELPTHYACSSAELFSKGAVSLLDQLNIVDYLVFGSEHGDLTALLELANFLNQEPPNYKNALHSELKAGNSFPKARSNAIKATFKDHSDLLKGSNNILAIEYLRSLLDLNSTITPYTLQRKGSAYLDEKLYSELPSATAIRKYLLSHGLTEDSILKLISAMPQSVLNELIQMKPHIHPTFMEDLYPIVKYLLTVLSTKEIKMIYDFPEELFFRLQKKATEHNNYFDFLESSMTKNYTKATIQRSIIHMYLNIQQRTLSSIQTHKKYHEYIRILGVKKEATHLINHIKERSQLEVITNYRTDLDKLCFEAQQQLLQENIYTRLYHQLSDTKRKHVKKDDFKQKIILHP